MFGRGRWQRIIRFSSFIVDADAIYAISLLCVPASSLFSCLIEGCCDTAIQGRDCRGQHSSDQALYINHYKSSISTTTCHVFKHRNVADGQLLAVLDAGEFAAKSALVKEGSVTLMKRSFIGTSSESLNMPVLHGSSSMIRNTICSGIPWHGSSSKCNLENNSWRGETLNCTSLSFENVWHRDISDAK